MHNNELLSIEKPARYMGGETGSVRKENPEVRFVLAFPDVYEVGMSHLGLQILYAVLNGVEWIAAERVYAPWPDMEELLRSSARLLATMETSTPLGAVDIVGFTLQHELSYTNILNMMELSGIPLSAQERQEGYPLILGGGPCAMNPEPLADFFDAFLLGDGEEAVLAIAEVCRDWKREGEPKEKLLERLAAIDGVYVPSFFDIRYRPDGGMAEIVPLRSGYEKIRRRVVAEMESAPYPTNPVVPFLKTVHDRVSMEVARGCSSGCRFCQAGYIYRPVRERTPEKILRAIDETLKNTGYEEVSLLSLSTADYRCLSPLLKSLMERYSRERIAVSLPSLRVGKLTREMVDEIKKVRKTGFTLAPEAGSDRLRRVINKGITEDALLENAFEIYSAGWRVIKLYFMIGLPSETMEDVQGIVELSAKVKREGKRTGNGGDVNVSVGSFVPKPHTPFQWERQISYEEILEKQQFLRAELKRKKLNFKWQDAPQSVLEGVFARGDRRLGAVLVQARRLGCRFDSWGEHFDFRKWQNAFAAAGIDPLFYHRRREFDEILPWDHLDSGVTREFLREEWEKSQREESTLDCRSGKCTGCGVCDFRQVKMRLCDDRGECAVFFPRDETVEAAGEPEASSRIRLRFSKLGAMAMLSHLELLSTFSRAVKRAGIPIRYSGGFHPHPKFSFATALSVGVESFAEYMDMEIAPGFGADKVRDSLNRVLPEGMKVLEAREIPLRSDSLSTIMDKVRYRVTLPERVSAEDLPARANAFLAREEHIHRRVKQSKVVVIDLRRELHQLCVNGRVLEMVVGRGKPLEFAAAITGMGEEILAGARVEKLEVIFTEQAEPNN